VRAATAHSAVYLVAPGIRMMVPIGVRVPMAMVPLPGMRMPAMPPVGVDPAPRLCLRHHGRGAEQKSGEPGEDEFLHRHNLFELAFLRQ
jgi:hypothetical protein